MDGAEIVGTTEEEEEDGGEEIAETTEEEEADGTAGPPVIMAGMAHPPLEAEVVVVEVEVAVEEVEEEASTGGPLGGIPDMIPMLAVKTP